MWPSFSEKKMFNDLDLKDFTLSMRIFLWPNPYFPSGWSRYDHFAVLCELLPVAVPSLVLDLITISRPVNLGTEVQQFTVRPRRIDSFYIVTNYIKWVESSGTYRIAYLPFYMSIIRPDIKLGVRLYRISCWPTVIMGPHSQFLNEFFEYFDFPPPPKK